MSDGKGKVRNSCPVSLFTVRITTVPSRSLSAPSLCISITITFAFYPPSSLIYSSLTIYKTLCYVRVQVTYKYKYSAMPHAHVHDRYIIPPLFITENLNISPLGGNPLPPTFDIKTKYTKAETNRQIKAKANDIDYQNYASNCHHRHTGNGQDFGLPRTWKRI